jgi:glutaminase
MPAKSGVGGGIIAVLPGRFGIGIFSPCLDPKGNSVRGIEVCRHLSKDLDLHVFSRGGEPGMALGRVYTAASAPSWHQPMPEMRLYIEAHAERIKYLCLHGYLAADGIEYVIRQMIGMAAESHSFILDMHQVDGISEAAARLLHDARLRFAGDDIAVVFSRIHGRHAIEHPLVKASPPQAGGYLSFEDNDLAVEWCENRLLAAAPEATPASVPLAGCITLRGLPPELLARLEQVSTARTFAAGEQILTAGQASDGRVYFIETGSVSVLVPLEDGAHQRVAFFGPGMSFGEMALLGQTTRSASVVANCEVNCRVLAAHDIDHLARDTPAIKIILLENLARDLAAKLRRATKWISALA